MGGKKKLHCNLITELSRPEQNGLSGKLLEVVDKQ